MNNIEGQIEEVLEKIGAGTVVQTWMNQPSPMFKNKTPRQMIDEDQGEEVLKKLNVLYNRKERKPQKES